MLRFVGIDGFIDEAELQFLDVVTGEQKRVCMSWSDLEKVQTEIQVALMRHNTIMREMEEGK